MTKIALCMIVRDVEATLPRLLDSVSGHVDAIYVTDTGSKDRTVEIAKGYGAHVSHFEWVDDFAAARNHSFDLVPAEYGYLLWLDGDDVLDGGENLRAIASQLEIQGHGSAYITYDYDISPETGQVLVTHPRERLVRNGAYRWKGRIHEVLVPVGSRNEGVFTDLAKVRHFPEEGAGKGRDERNLRILRAQYGEEGESKDPRTEYYLARSLYDLGEFQEASPLFQDYLEHSGWDEERAQAWNYLGEIAKNTGDPDTAIYCYLEAVKERPEFPTWFANLGVAYGMKKDWQRALWWAERALSVPQKDRTAMVLNPRDDMLRVLETVHLACFNMGRLDESWAAAKKLVELDPSNPTFIEREAALMRLRRWEGQTHAAIQIAEELAEEKETDKLQGFLNSLPGPVMGNAGMQAAKRKLLPPLKWEKGSVVYYCGKSIERWDPSSLEKGIGGSETAVIELSRRWAAAGRRVVVYGYPLKEETYDGVEYLFYWRFNPDDTFDTLISWRNELMFRNPIKARRKLLDLHDVPSAADYTEDILNGLDAIMVKSKYHASFLPNVPAEKFRTVSNGVSVPRTRGIVRKPHSLLYASSYDRGLQVLLEMWPKVREAVPDATLRIAYGWNGFDTVWAGNPERTAWKRKMEALMAQEGIEHLGRVSKKELYRLHRESQVLAYYCTFEEINCMTVLEAQSCGSLPVTTDYAALHETNEEGMRATGDPYDRATKETYLWLLIDTLKAGTVLGEGARLRIAEKYSWDSVAAKWLEAFDEA